MLRITDVSFTAAFRSTPRPRPGLLQPPVQIVPGPSALPESRRAQQPSPGVLYFPFPEVPQTFSVCQAEDGIGRTKINNIQAALSRRLPPTGRVGRGWEGSRTKQGLRV